MTETAGATSSALRGAGWALEPDPWLTGVLKRHCHRLVLESGSTDRSSLAELQGHLAASSRDVFVDCKVPTGDISAVRALETRGFRLVDASVQLELAPISDLGRPTVEVRSARPADEQSVVDIARAMGNSRFHLDPGLSRDEADNVKEHWVRSFFTGNRGRSLLVADRGTGPIGFLLLLDGPEGGLVIDLIAIDPDHRRHGVARSLIADAVRQCGHPALLRVGTQLANTPSLRLYESMGFRIFNSQFVLHYHGKAPEEARG